MIATAPQIKEVIRWEFFWFGELDMQRRTIPRLYGLAPGVVALTGLSGRGVPTGSMLGGILSAIDSVVVVLQIPVVDQRHHDAQSVPLAGARKGIVAPGPVSKFALALNMPLQPHILHRAVCADQLLSPMQMLREAGYGNGFKTTLAYSTAEPLGEPR